MKSSPAAPAAPHPPERRRFLVEAGVLVVCVAVALFLWTSRLRSDTALKTAGVEQLIEATKRDPNKPLPHLYLGMRHQEAGDPAAAKQAFQKAAELDGDSEQAWLGWAATASAVGATQESFAVLDVYLKSHPKSVPALLTLSDFYRSQDAIKRAHATAKRAAEVDPKSAEAWRRVATDGVKLLLYPEAEAAARRAVALAPKDWLAHYALGMALSRQRRTAEAVASFRQSAALAPDQAKPVRELGKIELSEAKDDAGVRKAVETLQRAQQIDPGKGETYFLLGRAYRRLSQWQEARQMLERAASITPNEPSPHFELASVYAKLGDPARAKAAQQRHQALEAYRLETGNLLSLIYEENAKPEKSNARRLKLARLYAGHGDVAAAVREYQHLLARTPDNAAAKRELEELQRRTLPAASAPAPSAASAGAPTASPEALLGLLDEGDRLLAQGQFAAAKRAFAQALQRDPRAARGFLGLGLALAGEGNDEDAFRAFHRALEAAPDLAAAQFELAKLYIKMGFEDEAIRRLDALQKKYPDNPSYHYLKGLAFQKLEMPKPAEEQFAKAYAADPSQVDYLISLAYAESKTGRTAEAERHYREAAVRDPQNGDLLAFFGSFLAERAQQTRDPKLDQEAEETLKRSLTLAPDNFTAVLGLGNLYLSRNDPKRAVPLFETAVKLRPDLVSPWYRLSLAYERAGDAKRSKTARATFRRLSDYNNRRTATEQLARERSDDPAMRLKLARIYAEGGDFARAINQYQVSLTLDPKSAAVKKELNALIEKLKRTGQLPAMDVFNGMVYARTGQKATSPTATPPPAAGQQAR